MPTSHIGTDVIQLQPLLIFAFGGERSASRSGRCVPMEAFRHPQIGVREGHHRRCGRYGEEKNMLPHVGNQTPYSSAHSLVTILSYPGNILLIADNYKENVRVSSNGSLKIAKRAIVWFYKLQGKTDAFGVLLQKDSSVVQEGKRERQNES